VSQLSRVLRRSEGGRYLTFMCPGCKDHHALRIGTDPHLCWSWNGSAHKPTFRPSIKVTGVRAIHRPYGRWTGEYERDAEGAPLPLVCHSYVTDGSIQFLGDCTHALANQTVPLPSVDWV
jgi:hypothetical protein